MGPIVGLLLISAKVSNGLFNVPRLECLSGLFANLPRHTNIIKATHHTHMWDLQQKKKTLKALTIPGEPSAGLISGEQEDCKRHIICRYSVRRQPIKFPSQCVVFCRNLKVIDDEHLLSCKVIWLMHVYLRSRNIIVDVVRDQPKDYHPRFSTCSPILLTMRIYIDLHFHLTYYYFL